MLARDFLLRLEDIRVKDKKYEVYPLLVKMDVQEVIGLIERVDYQLADEQIEKMIEEVKIYAKKKL